jgi:septum site-determining protein MinC
LLVTLGSGPLDEVLAELGTRLGEKAGFFEGARVIVQAAERSLAAGDLLTLQRILAQYNMTLWAVLGEAEDTRVTARQLGLATRLGGGLAPQPDETAGQGPGGVPPFMRPTPEPAAAAESAVAPEQPPAEPPATDVAAPPAQSAPPAVPVMEDGIGGLFVRRTLRSGKSLRYVGAVVVLGDVNPGAEIVAGGDVVVWGKLRGMVHAGAMGDEHAVVCALDMAPMQLRIAGRIAIPPDERRKRRQPAPELARVEAGRIVVEEWTPKTGRE